MDSKRLPDEGRDSPHRTPADRRGPALRILVVEDHPDTADSMVALLRLYGYETQAVPDGSQALQAAEADPPDVVLLDLGLPGMDGYEVAKRLRAQKLTKRPLLIAVTGYGEDTERLRSYEAGIDLHLTKPVGIEEVRRFLERFQTVNLPRAD